MALLNYFPERISNLYFHGNRKDKKIALTFDDGPSKETERILKILKENNSKATFFIWGQRIRGREKIIKRIIKEGHEIGNHSYSHKRMAFKSKKFIEKEIIKCDKELGVLGVKTDLFRPPKFSMGPNLLKTCKKLGKKIILCDVISDDWKKPKIDLVLNKVLGETKKGSIVNFHDYLEGIGSNEQIVSVINKSVPSLKDKYKLVTVSEILK